MTNTLPPILVVDDEKNMRLSLEAVMANVDLVVATVDTDRVNVAQLVRRTGAPLYVQPSRNVTDLVEAVQRAYRPNAVLAWGEPFASPLWEGRHDGYAYVCRHYACQAPAKTVPELLQQL